MKYLIIAATGQEIPLFTDHLPSLATESGDHEIDVLVTGVGLLATAYSLTAKVATSPPDFIIQAGIAGCFDKSIPLGTVFAVERELVADQGVVDAGTWRSTMDMGFTASDQLPYTDGWLVNPQPRMNNHLLQLANAVSVNQVSTDLLLAAQWQQRYGAVLESMEGAALHYVAIREQIPFLQIRAVSNYVGERDKTKWDFKNAIINLNNELRKLLPVQ